MPGREFNEVDARFRRFAVERKHKAILNGLFSVVSAQTDSLQNMCRPSREDVFLIAFVFVSEFALNLLVPVIMRKQLYYIPGRSDLKSKSSDETTREHPPQFACPEICKK